MLKRVVKTIRGVPISQKLLWLLVAALTIILINSMHTTEILQMKINDLENEIYKTEELFGRISSYNLLERLSDIVCEHDEKLNSKRLICP